MSEFYVGFHHSIGPIGDAITLATEAGMDGPWTFGGERPATHAFAVFRHSRHAYRVDATPDGVVWAPLTMPYPTKLWVVPTTAALGDAVWEAAKSRTGQPYDFAELGAQVLVPAGRAPWLRRFITRATTATWARDAAICTRVTMDLIGVAGYGISFPDLLPERLARWAGSRLTEVAI